MLRYARLHLPLTRRDLLQVQRQACTLASRFGVTVPPPHIEHTEHSGTGMLTNKNHIEIVLDLPRLLPCFCLSFCLILCYSLCYDIGNARTVETIALHCWRLHCLLDDARSAMLAPLSLCASLCKTPSDADKQETY